MFFIVYYFSLDIFCIIIVYSSNHDYNDHCRLYNFSNKSTDAASSLGRIKRILLGCLELVTLIETFYLLICRLLLHVVAI